jgi:hypothetical protein
MAFISMINLTTWKLIQNIYKKKESWNKVREGKKVRCGDDSSTTNWSTGQLVDCVNWSTGLTGVNSSTPTGRQWQLVDTNWSTVSTRRHQLVDSVNSSTGLIYYISGQLVDRANWSTSKTSSCWTDRACLILPEASLACQEPPIRACFILLEASLACQEPPIRTCFILPETSLACQEPPIRACFILPEASLACLFHSNLILAGKAGSLPEWSPSRGPLEFQALSLARKD